MPADVSGNEIVIPGEEFDSVVSGNSFSGSGSSADQQNYYLADTESIVQAVDNLNHGIQSGFIVVSILLGIIVGNLFMKGFWIGKD